MPFSFEANPHFNKTMHPKASILSLKNNNTQKKRILRITMECKGEETLHIET